MPKKDRVLQIYVSDKLHEKLIQLSKEREESISSMVRAWIREKIQCEKP